MRRHAALIAAAALGVVLACGALLARRGVARQDRPHGKAPATLQPGAEAQRVLQLSQGYMSWRRLPEYEEKAKFSKGHGGTHVVAWHNEVAARAVGGADGAFPVGSVMVKENRPQADARAAALTIMAKQADGWYWVKATPDGRRVFADAGRPVAGKVDMCIGCHEQAPHDMVFSGGDDE